ncbi:hypothetical protein BGLA2_810014 [Burkholderia gladioli]|nr:hypothetical protein BGLA2_810014 [Burkholderia gladioli]
MIRYIISIPNIKNSLPVRAVPHTRARHP